MAGSRAYRKANSIALTASASTTGVFPMHGASGFSVAIPTGSSITSLTVHVAVGEEQQDPSDLTFLPLYDSAATPAAIAMTSLTGGRCYAFNADVFSCGWVKLVANTTGTVDVQTKS